MNNTGPLFWYGLIVLAVTGCLALVPYLRRKAELLTAWNVLLISAAIFIGLGSFEAVASTARQSNLQWFHPTRQEVRWFMGTSTVFLVAMVLGYYYNPVARALAGGVLNKWPPLTTGVYLAVIGFCFGIQVMSLLTVGQTFFGPFFFKLSHKALTFSTVFAFILWYRNRMNPFWMALFCGVFLFACLTSIRVGTGRRLLLSIFVGPLLCIYWMQARHWRPTRTLAVFGAAISVVFVIGLMYSSIRHFSQLAGQARQERTTSAIIEQIQGIRNRPWLERFASDKLFYFGQQCVHYSLMVKRFVDEKKLEPRVLNTLKFVAGYPIPRRVWENKPVMIGATAPRVIAYTPTTNWGVGIAGHGAYEGGVFVVILYALLITVLIQFFDVPMKSQPENPFLIAMLAAASPHLVAWTRGDLGNMTIESGECLVFAFLLSIACRMLFGTERKKAAGANYVATTVPRATGYRYPSPPLRP